MIQSWKHIAVLMDATPGGEAIGRQAATLAQRHSAHLAGVFGVARDTHGHTQDSFARGTQAIQDVIARREHEDGERAAAAGRRFADILRAYDITSEFRVVWSDGLGADVLRSLHCDLIVAAHPKPHDLPEGWSAEYILLNNGGPLLLVPAQWSGERIGAHVMIAWNGSHKARRAIQDAMPFLKDAETVTILVVDGDRDKDRYGPTPGADVQAHLLRHEIAAEIRSVESRGAGVAETIAAQAIDLDADLTVIGAYSRPRASEIIFGGVTRALLARAPRPLLISN